MDELKATLRYRQLCRAALLSRWLLEAFALLSWSWTWPSHRLPPFLALCTALLRRLPAVLLHPASAFLLGNLIVLTLFARSLGAPNPTEDPNSSPTLPPPSDAGDVDDDHHRHLYCSYFPTPPPTQLQGGEEGEELVVYVDKAVCLESTAPAVAASATCCSSPATSPKQKGRQKDLPLSPPTRSSALPAAGKVGTGEKLLRRKAVEKCWQQEEEEAAEEEHAGSMPPPTAAAAEEVDDNEEFRRRIETFISKQLQFIEREESLLLATTGAVVAAGGGLDHHCCR